MTRDIYPLVVIDRAFDQILAGATSIGEHEGRDDTPANAAWCAKSKEVLKSHAPLLEEIRGWYDRGISPETAATSLMNNIAVMFTLIDNERRAW